MRIANTLCRAVAMAIIAGLAMPARAGTHQDTAAAQAGYDTWRDCVTRSAVVMAKRATAAEAAEAALGLCTAEEGRFRLELARWSTHGGWSRPFTMTQLNQHMALARRKMHEVGLAAAITGDPHPHPPPPVPAPPAKPSPSS
jgi:hypothetical protein